MDVPWLAHISPTGGTCAITLSPFVTHAWLVGSYQERMGDSWAIHVLVPLNKW